MNERFKIDDVDFLSFFFKLSLIKFELDFKEIVIMLHFCVEIRIRIFYDDYVI